MPLHGRAAVTPLRRHPLEDRVIYARLPGTVWLWLWETAVADIAEQLHEAADEEAYAESRWGSPEEQADTFTRYGMLVLTLREAVRQSTPASYDQVVAEIEDLQAELFRRLSFTPTAEREAFVKDLVIDADREWPKVRDHLMNDVMRELGMGGP